MFTAKKVSKNNSNKKSTQKGAATINKPELAADLGIDTSIDISNKDFLLSHGINRKLESGSLDRQIDIIETQQLGKLLGRGKQQSFFEDPLTRGTGNLGGLQLRDRLGRSSDIEDLAGQHSSVNRLGGAGSADRHDSKGDRQSAWKIVQKNSDNDIKYGVLHEEVLMQNSGDKENNEYIREEQTTGKDGSTFRRTEYFDADTHQDGSQTMWYEVTETVTDEDGNITQTITKRKTIEISASGEKNVIENSKTVDGDSTHKMENPFNDNNVRPMTDKDDPMGIIGDRDSMYKRLRIINPEINPMNEGDQSEYGNYINPALRVLGTSNGGRSTGAWEEVGGAYVGPNIGAINDSLGGTSTGNDWL